MAMVTVLDLSPITHLTREQFYQLCMANRDTALERTVNGELVIVSPIGGKSGNREADLIAKVVVWNEQTGLGVVFSSSTVFSLPVGRWVPLAVISSLIADIDHKMPKAVDGEEGIKFLSAKDLLDDGTLNLTQDVKRISHTDYERLSRKVKPQRNDIIYSRIGARLGKARLVETDERFLVSYSCCTIRPLIVHPMWLTRYLDSEFVLRRALRETKSIGVPDLGLARINEFAVPLCSLTEQVAIVERINECFQLNGMAQNCIRESKIQLDRLNQSILAKAFRGELVEQDPNDEPASILLDRIRAEREAQQPAKKSQRRGTAGRKKQGI